MHRILPIALLAVVACHSTPAAVAPPPPAPVVKLTKDTLEVFVRDRFPAAVAAGTVTLDWGDGAGVSEALLQELTTMGITTSAELDAIIPSDYATKGIGAIAASEAPTTTIAGFIRDLLVLHDVRGYFTNAWNHSWEANGPQDFPAPAAYGVDFDVMAELGVFGGDDDGDDDGTGEYDDTGE